MEPIRPWEAFSGPDHEAIPCWVAGISDGSEVLRVPSPPSDHGLAHRSIALPGGLGPYAAATGFGRTAADGPLPGTGTDTADFGGGERSHAADGSVGSVTAPWSHGCGAGSGALVGPGNGHVLQAEPRFATCGGADPAPALSRGITPPSDGVRYGAHEGGLGLQASGDTHHVASGGGGLELDRVRIRECLERGLPEEFAGHVAIRDIAELFGMPAVDLKRRAGDALAPVEGVGRGMRQYAVRRRALERLTEMVCEGTLLLPLSATPPGGGRG